MYHTSDNYTFFNDRVIKRQNFHIDIGKMKKDSLNLDSNNRIKFDGQNLNYEFSSYHNCLPLDLKIIDNLKHDCLEAYNCKTTRIDNNVSPSDYHSSGSTYFQRADAAPRSCLEDLALQIFHFHTKDTQFIPELSGAEFWTQVVDCQDDIGFHWDRDYGLESDTGVNIYPHLATVLYLTDMGGPTFIVSKVGSLYSQDDHSGEADEIIINKPMVGKHVKFDGRLLHAAPSLVLVESTNDDKEVIPTDRDIHKIGIAELDTQLINKKECDDKPKRITFLVNIWLNHVPKQAQSYPVDAINSFVSPVSEFKLFSNTSNVVDSKKGSSQQQTDAVITKFDKSSKISNNCIEKLKSKVPSIDISSKKLIGELELHRWIFINGGIKYRISIPLPSSIGLISLCTNHDAFNLKYARSDLNVRVDNIDEESVDNCSPMKKRRRSMWTPVHKDPFAFLRNVINDKNEV